MINDARRSSLPLAALLLILALPASADDGQPIKLAFRTVALPTHHNVFPAFARLRPMPADSGVVAKTLKALRARLPCAVEISGRWDGTQEASAKATQRGRDGYHALVAKTIGALEGRMVVVYSGGESGKVATTVDRVEQVGGRIRVVLTVRELKGGASVVAIVIPRSELPIDFVREGVVKGTAKAGQ